MNFFEKEKNLIPFTKDHKEYLKLRLNKYGYFVQSENESGIDFGCEKDARIQSYLTNTGLYFRLSFEFNSIFETSMTASEFTDIDDFAKYDLQEGE